MPSEEEEELSAYIPQYLQGLIRPYHGEYCYTPIFKARFIAQLMAEGFLPVASSRAILLPKLHQHRSCITLPHGLHVSKNVRKKAKRFSITINTRFQDIIQGCHDQHGSHCWLYPPLVEAFRAMFDAGQLEAHPFDENTGSPIPGRVWPVRLYTVEVWNDETGELAAGELGYSVGSIYTSLTGFTKEDSAGSVQLAALGRLLIEKGFELWDMGMHMEYKSSIGAELMPRDTFLGHVHRVRETQSHRMLPSRQPAQNCKEVIDRNSPAAAAAAATGQAKSSKKMKKKVVKEAAAAAAAAAALKQQGGDDAKEKATTATCSPVEAIASKSPKEQVHAPPRPDADEKPTKKKARTPALAT
mgnify:CR=1 FL=1